jgi:hypothetical protein
MVITYRTLHLCESYYNAAGSTTRASRDQYRLIEHDTHRPRTEYTICLTINAVYIMTEQCADCSCTDSRAISLHRVMIELQIGEPTISTWNVITQFKQCFIWYVIHLCNDAVVATPRYKHKNTTQSVTQRWYCASRDYYRMYCYVIFIMPPAVSPAACGYST